MSIVTNLMRTHMKLLSPFLKRGDIASARRLQERMGSIMAMVYEKEVGPPETITFPHFTAAWTKPKEPPEHGVCMYFHGGGYVAGDLEYALGFGTTLAMSTKRRVLCPDYRLAPEHPFPAAVDDALTAYCYLLQHGYSGSDIILVGESAGGGLIYSLALRLIQEKLPLPAGIVALCPWTDLTLSGTSYTTNVKTDLSLSPEMLAFYSDAYIGQDKKNPIASPLFANLEQMPPSLIYAGGDELLLSDAVRMADALKKQGASVQLHVEPDMWHGYMLYGIAEARKALDSIALFIHGQLQETE